MLCTLFVSSIAGTTLCTVYIHMIQYTALREFVYKPVRCSTPKDAGGKTAGEDGMREEAGEGRYPFSTRPIYLLSNPYTATTVIPDSRSLAC